MDSEKKAMPKHLGIIMDGNGRWAKARNMPRTLGHKEGVKRVLEVVRACYKLSIPYLSLYAFSTENWKRPEQEVSNLMYLLRTFIDQYIDELDENGVKLNIMGDLSALGEKTRKMVTDAVKRTESNGNLMLNIGLNYGGQDEILRAARALAQKAVDGKISVDEIDKESFENELYTRNQPPLDLLIRPSGELRVSNFMLWQMAYAEFWFSDILWPDFTEETLKAAIEDYQVRDRRFGGV